MRRLPALLMALVLVATAFLLPAHPTSAATFRNRVAQAPATPTSAQSVRVWMQSDTAFGETAGLEYNPVGTGTYVKVLGTFDTSGPAPANWRADIPAYPNGAQVQYQLFTRNQSGQDYGFTGFNWNYTVDDGDIQWDGLRHSTFDSYYRSPFGAAPAGANVTLRFRTARFDVDGVSLRVYQYNPATGTTGGASDYSMTYLEDRVEGGTTYAIWTYTLATPASPAILYYKFRINDRLDEDYYSDAYADDHDNLGQGGEGAPSDNEPFPSFQITVYNPSFQTPAWLQNANVYQIFPDRFRNGDPTNDYCRAGGATGCPTFYGDIPATLHTTWNEAPEDGRVTGKFNRDFFGGDLKGIQDKLDYLQSLGIDTLYLTPIFSARSNHRYDADDYLTVDPALGGDAAFASLAQELDQRGMHIILDGVFNHTSSDSLYFDRYHRYTGNNGACESLGSSYRNWYDFHNNNVPCGAGDYEGWFGFDSLAVLTDGSSAVRDFIYRDSGDNVTKHWYDRGASGWRFDVADEITHNWWRDYRPYAKSYQSDGPLIGEVWYDASQFLLGDQLDSVMSYRFRKNILGFARGTAQWNDNDNNGSNNIPALVPSQFDQALKSVREDYPPQATAAMLNLVDSHDTNRALYVLTLQGDSGLTQAKERLKLTALFQFTYLGAPMVYYGDEAAIDAPSQTNGANGPEDDPYNRAPYPWADESGNQNLYGPADTGMISYYSTLAHLRQQHPALRTGSVETLLTGDTTAAGSDNNTYAFARVGGGEQAVVVLNNGAGANTASVPVGGYFANGTSLQDALSGTSYTVSGGNVSVTLAARGGAVLFPAPASADTTPPTANATVSPPPNANGYNNTSPVTVNLSGSDSGSGIKELRYWVNSGNVTVAPGASASVTVSAQGSTVVSVRAVDNAGNISAVASVTVRIDTTAPDTTIDSGPPALSNSSSASFAFSSSEAGSSFACSLDGGAFVACASPASYTNLADGNHTFEVRALDAAGNPNPTPASYTWMVDTAPPDTVIDTNPPALSNSGSAGFTFHATKSGSTFECKLDSGAFTACASPKNYSGLADGSHTFEVRALDAAGSDPTPASYTWTVDTTAPDTTIDSGPPALSSSSSASFAFSSSEAGSSFACSLDGGAFAPCTSPASYNSLVDGSHTFTVKAIDAAGNADITPAGYTWTVDTTPPDTTITSGPSNPTNSSSASFSFTSTESNSLFQCALDGGAFAACASPKSYSGLAVGNHTFAVRGTDAAGNTDTTAASYAWTIVAAYNFTGFFQPVDNLPVLNVVNAGSAIPVKFSLGGNYGLNIFVTGYPVSQQITCSTTVPIDPIEETVTAGASGLSYDPATDRYHYIWKTDKAWSNTCRQLIVRFNDGTERRANFSFKK